jgi:hypothetical protein
VVGEGWVDRGGRGASEAARVERGRGRQPRPLDGARLQPSWRKGGWRSSRRIASPGSTAIVDSSFSGRAPSLCWGSYADPSSDCAGRPARIGLTARCPLPLPTWVSGEGDPVRTPQVADFMRCIDVSGCRSYQMAKETGLQSCSSDRYTAANHPKRDVSPERQSGPLCLRRRVKRAVPRRVSLRAELDAGVQHGAANASQSYAASLAMWMKRSQRGSLARSPLLNPCSVTCMLRVLRFARQGSVRLLRSPSHRTT